MSKQIAIRLGGDVMPGGGVLDAIRRHGPSYPFQHLIDNRGDHDLFFCNLECTLATSENPPHPQRIKLHSTPEIVTPLLKAGINIVSLANNHAFDYGLESFIQTKQILNSSNIACIGGGENHTEARQPTTLEINGITIGFLGYCTQDTGCRHIASNTEYGVANPPLNEMIADIKSLKNNNAVVIISMHWGDEFREYPSLENVQLARTLIDNGATIIVGHHGHVMQGYEKYKNGLILYDLGSVIFGDIFNNNYKFYLKKKKHRESILVDCLLNGKGILDFNIIPIYINNSFQATFPQSSQRISISRRLNKQSNKITHKYYKLFYTIYMQKLAAIRLYSETVHLLTHPRHLLSITVGSFIKGILRKKP